MASCGPTHIGQTVRVCGWVARRREHGEHLAFVDVRDHAGVVQCVVDNTIDVRSEYVVRITGVVRQRPEGTVNASLPTGDVEIGECEVEVLRTATPPPFPIDARADDVDENVRLQYRYLDLRRERMQRNLRVRAAVNSAVRRAMEDQGFVEVETPMLVPSTPEGAREFLVPSRKEPGSFYALPQSPQLFKQLLMVAGVDRYFQIARCLRDEDLRADRQYEFMQLDAEMSFVDQDDVLDAISRAVLDAAEAVTGERPPEIERITWHEAMERFGVDKPDMRFGLELVELTDVFGATEFKAFAGAAAIKGIRVPGAASEYGRNQLDKLTDRAKSLGAKGLVWLKVAEDGSFDSPVAKFLSAERVGRGVDRVGAEPGDLVLVVADEWATTCEVLGQLRNDLARPPVHEGPYRYVWVVDFPMFVGRDEQGNPKPGHHPFTMPHLDDMDAAGDRPDGRALAGLRPRAQRVGARLGLDPDPSDRAAAQGLRRPRHHRRGGRPQVRVLPQPVRVRRPAPRRVRLRPRPPGGDPGRRGEHPRGHRLPQDAVGHRSDDPLAAPRRPRPADPTRHPRPPPRLTGLWTLLAPGRQRDAGTPEKPGGSPASGPGPVVGGGVWCAG